jgi:hypothetical protein
MKIKEIAAEYEYESATTADAHKQRVNHVLRELMAALYGQPSLPDVLAIEVRVHRNPHVEGGRVVSRRAKLVAVAHLPMEAK